MKTSIFKRSMALFLAFLLCFTTFIGSAVTPAFAAGTESEVVLIGFPRNGDDMYHTGTWGNEALTLMNGWCIYRSEPASCTENFRQAAGENPPPRRRRTSLFWIRF